MKDYEEIFWAWEFDPELTENSEILCPECHEWSHVSEWRESEVGCEDCGSHAAIVCPLCDEYHDHIFAETFQSRAAPNYPFHN